MRLEDECTLSFYKEIATLNSEHRIYLVQNQDDQKIYVKKVLTTYNEGVYRYLKKYPVLNMPRIYEVVADGDQLIVIEEYLSGNTLQELINSGERFNKQRTADIMVQLCDILDELHHAQPPIIHRDIKPSNIIESPDGVVKLIDLNAAKLSNERAGMDTRLMGTAGYAAPEQYGFSVSGVKTDIYSAGVLMNVLLIGTPPVERLAPEPFGHIISRCTQMDPEKRYSSIWALREAIYRLACPSTSQEPEYKWNHALPGFRSGKPSSMIGASLGYLLILRMGWAISVESSDIRAIWINRIGVILTLFSIVLFWGDFMGMQEKIGLKRPEKPSMRFLSNILFSMAIFVMGAVLTALIESIVCR